MTFSKKTREIVYNKYKGHCAYCGCELSISEMQIDHIDSRFLAQYHGKEINNSIGNLMPACRMCNFYKSSSDLEGFRKTLSTVLKDSCRKSFTVRLAIKYGFLSIGEWDGNFYFEKEGAR